MMMENNATQTETMFCFMKTGHKLIAFSLISSLSIHVIIIKIPSYQCCHESIFATDKGLIS